MNIERIKLAYLAAKRSGMLRGAAAKLGLLILIVFVPGGLPLVLSAYIYERYKRVASTAAAHPPHATGAMGESVWEKVYRMLGHWEGRP